MYSLLIKESLIITNIITLLIVVTDLNWSISLEGIITSYLVNYSSHVIYFSLI